MSTVERPILGKAGAKFTFSLSFFFRFVLARLAILGLMRLVKQKALFLVSLPMSFFVKRHSLAEWFLCSVRV
jgi:hypothetical protein